MPSFTILKYSSGIPTLLRNCRIKIFVFHQTRSNNFTAIGHRSGINRHLYRRGQKYPWYDSTDVSIAHSPKRIGGIILFLDRRAGNGSLRYSQQINSRLFSQPELFGVFVYFAYSQTLYIIKASAYFVKINIGRNRQGLSHIHPAVRFPVFKDSFLVGEKRIGYGNTASAEYLFPAKLSPSLKAASATKALRQSRERIVRKWLC